VAAGNSLYVLGGFNGKELGDMHAFDIAAGSWKQLDLAGTPQPLPPRSVAGIAAAPAAGKPSPAGYDVGLAHGLAVWGCSSGKQHDTQPGFPAAAHQPLKFRLSTSVRPSVQ
jgi:Galactose oxidase, central domain